MKRQAGFTLIELITVIVILGALAAVAVPRYVDLQDDAEQAAAEAVASAISSAFALNYASSLAGHTGISWGNSPGPDEFVKVNDGGSVSLKNETQVAALLTGGDLSAYTIDGTSCAASNLTEAGDTVTCKLKDDDSNASATFTVIATN